MHPSTRNSEFTEEAIQIMATFKPREQFLNRMSDSLKLDVWKTHIFNEAKQFETLDEAGALILFNQLLLKSLIKQREISDDEAIILKGIVITMSHMPLPYPASDSPKQLEDLEKEVTVENTVASEEAERS